MVPYPYIPQAFVVNSDTVDEQDSDLVYVDCSAVLILGDSLNAATSLKMEVQ